MPSVSSPRELLLGWVGEPDPAHALRTPRSGGAWDVHGFPDLADRARRIAAGLADAGCGPGARVAVGGTGRDLVAGIYGVLWAGGTAAVLPTGAGLGSDDGPRLRVILRALEPAALLAGPAIRERLTRESVRSGVVLDPAALGDPAGPRPQTPMAPAGDAALIQFTSGTSGPARAVTIPWTALAANVWAIRQWLAAGPDDAWATWLPMHHDMGLVGCLVTPLAGGNDVWLSRPQDFLRDPLPYLRCFAEGGATITATPGFGLERILRAVPESALAGLDFSGWRAVVVGAERTDPDLLRRFQSRFGPRGLHPAALTPAYGLAEATLAATGTPVGRTWRQSRPDGSGPATRPVLGCGVPLPGCAVRIIGENGHEVPDGELGEIEVLGPGVATGYLPPGPEGDPADDTTSPPAGAPGGHDGVVGGGVLRTGDAGFRRDGELFVLGRLGDALKIRGRPVFAEDAELLLAEAGLPRHRLAVLLGDGPEDAVCVAVLERPEPGWADTARAVLGRVVETVSVRVIPLGTAGIPRTTSGKVRRRELWRRLDAGRLTTADGGEQLAVVIHGPPGHDQEGHPRHGAV